jgi:ankyrin repeat protein
VAVQRLLEAGVDPAERDEQDFAAIHYAAASGDAAVITCSIGQGASM